MTHPPATPLPHHTVDGPEDAPPLLLGPSLGASLAVWDPQLPSLARHHRVIRWDLPGHGGTPTGVLGAGPAPTTTVPGLARLVLGLADSLGIDRFAYAGISLGGAVGAWLAAHHPERIASLALICSSARFGEPAGWQDRAALVREAGIGPIAEAAASRWFTPSFAGSPQATALLDAVRRSVAPAGYAACCDALAAFDLRAGLARITAPTLVVAGLADPATPPAHARELADGIADVRLLELSGAAHLANVERPAPVLAALLGHLAAHPDSGLVATAPGPGAPAPHPAEGTAQ
ncbi:alpha/beta fold hydrolase [Streptomyces libani]|uniref:alpha/beta fold hydrolase n=1 Tax=Streptomyces TaxID=1883 RepID=UPI00140EBCD0|nr:alpha/beta fold hydrolase [Streptomyces sp. ID38640]QIK05950.1 alpha/beta fold hydrolase [Streptomyces sp. ID38640]